MRGVLGSSLARVGGAFNLVQAAAYLVAGAAALFIPLERVGHDTSSFVAFYSASPAPYTILGLALIVLGVLGFTGVVPATAALLDEPRNGWVTFGKSVALLSLAVIVVYYTWFLSTMPAFVSAYLAAPASLGPALALSDPHAPANWVAWFIFGGMGLWVVVVGVVGRRQGSLPRGYGWACAIKTVGFWIALAGVISQILPLAKAGVAIGVLVGGPLYHAWLGVHMLRISRRDT